MVSCEAKIEERMLGMNSDNVRKGADFQRCVQSWFQERFGPGFYLEAEILIGNPAKGHRFDIVNPVKKIAVECKRYTWTETGECPWREDWFHK